MQKIAEQESVMTHKQLVWEMKYGFNWSINVYGSVGNIKAMTETLYVAVAIRDG